jgi:hypothetical protein
MSYSCHLRPDKNWNLTISYVLRIQPVNATDWPKEVIRWCHSIR